MDKRCLFNGTVFISFFILFLLYLFFLVWLGNFYYKLGDASSPHGSNCLQFNGSGIGGDGSKSSSPSLPAANGNEGLSRQQLDLISQIMQQAKPSVSLTSSSIQNGQKSIQRPRTWNIQVKTIAFFFISHKMYTNNKLYINCVIRILSKMTVTTTTAKKNEQTKILQ